MWVLEAAGESTNVCEGQCMSVCVSLCVNACVYC